MSDTATYWILAEDRAGLAPRANTERVVLVIPRWEIETWADHLLRGAAVSEDRKSGWRSDKSERECRIAGRVFREHRRSPDRLPACCPPSLVSSDGEFERLDGA